MQEKRVRSPDREKDDQTDDLARISERMFSVLMFHGQSPLHLIYDSSVKTNKQSNYCIKSEKVRENTAGSEIINFGSN
jgi:hypothetical protein